MTTIKLIVGLGNPGTRYDGTPHNIGFDVIDALARQIGAPAFSEKRRFQALLSEAVMPGIGKVTLMKPLTYMNVSGAAVGPWCNKNGVDPEQVVVVCDDVNIELGTIRLRPSGRDGGQKGLRDIINRLGTPDVPRLRLGIRPFGVKKVPNLTEYVLHKWWGVAKEVAAESALLGCETLNHLIRTGDIEQTMNRYNAERIEVEPAD